MQWLLRNARLADDVPLVDIAVDAGQIAAIGPAQKVDAEQVWDLDGRVVLPGLIDAHTHLDKTYLNVQNLSGTLHEAIEQWGMAKATRSREQILVGCAPGLDHCDCQRRDGHAFACGHLSGCGSGYAGDVAHPA